MLHHKTINIGPNYLFKTPVYLLCWVVLIGLVCLIFFHPTPQSSPDVANFYRGTIVELNPQLEFKLDCCSQRLQLGLVKTEDQSQENLSSIKSLMEQYELSCTATNMGERQVDVDTVYCSTSDGLISGLLVSEGLVKENCEASANQFVTCD
jgi:hypothetical protein